MFGLFSRIGELITVTWSCAFQVLQSKAKYIQVTNSCPGIVR